MTSNVNCLMGMRCPKCDNYGPFRIECSVLMTVTDDGAEADGGDTQWTEDSYCKCFECDYEAKVIDFLTLIPEDNG